VHRLIAVAALFLCTACTQLQYFPVPAPNPSLNHAVVFDIDGTLTPNVPAISEVREDAAKAVRAYADKGYKIIYLSARVGWLSAGIPSWLARHGFPEGSVHVAQNDEEWQHPDAYKTRMLQEFLAAGWKIDYAFGDSSTDLTSYAAAGIPKEHVFALLRKGQSACQPGVAAKCLAHWSEHLDFVSTSVPEVRRQ
jgi:phosphatidate phosphatase PAH1